jgi:hypothetical protein
MRLEPNTVNANNEAKIVSTLFLLIPINLQKRATDHLP